MTASDDRLADLMAAAHRTNAGRDRSDQESGWATPTDGGPDALMDTAILAIKAGIAVDDWSCVAEGLAMLETYVAQRERGGDE